MIRLANNHAPAARPPGRGRRRLRPINPVGPLSAITIGEIVRKMTFPRRGLFMRPACEPADAHRALGEPAPARA